MFDTKTLAAAFAATTILAGGFAYSANQAYAADQAGSAGGMSQQEQATIGSDAQKMSHDAQAAFADIAHARLSIFDGDPDTAKKLVEDASAAFDRAKTDRSIFMKAEGDFPQASADKKAASDDKAKTPVAWLPVDGAVVMNEDFTATPAKKAAVADANKKLASGDRKGAMEKLKLADVDVDFVMAVVPVHQTITDIDQANKLVQDGKYYETSQMLRKIEDSVRYDSWNVRSAPNAAQQNNQKTKASQ